MCGCNSGNVKYANNAPIVETAQYVVPAPKRKLTTSCDTRGVCGRVEVNQFITSETGLTTFTRAVNGLGSNFPKEHFNVVMNSQAISAIGLRQLAEEFASMADELDGQKTVVSLAGVVTIKRKTKKKTKVKTKALKTVKK